MAILPKNPDHETFLEGLNYAVEHGLISESEKEQSLLEGISEDLWKKIKAGTEDLTERPLIFALVLKKLDRQLIHPDYSNYKENPHVFPI